MTLGQRIQEIRIGASLSQEAFGEKLGTTRQTVSKWELDQTVPEISKIVMMSRLFSVTTDSILVDGISTFDFPYRQFVCGVYRSEQYEIVETERFSLVYYCTPDQTAFGTKLYMGIGKAKKLWALCEYSQTDGNIGYAYRTEANEICSNKKELERRLGEVYDEKLVRALRRTEQFFVDHEKHPLPGVGDAGIRKCLESWRMFDVFYAGVSGFRFSLCTGRTEYIFQIFPQDTNIYSGISYNVPFDLGIMGGRQFFRIRNYKDNSEPWCQFFSNLGYEYNPVEIPVEECRMGECVRSRQGYLLWCLKRYTEDEIVLQGCGSDEYTYRRVCERDEVFTNLSVSAI